MGHNDCCPCVESGYDCCYCELERLELTTQPSTNKQTNKHTHKQTNKQTHAQTNDPRKEKHNATNRR